MPQITEPRFETRQCILLITTLCSLKKSTSSASDKYKILLKHLEYQQTLKEERDVDEKENCYPLTLYNIFVFKFVVLEGYRRGVGVFKKGLSRAVIGKERGWGANAYILEHAL